MSGSPFETPSSHPVSPWETSPADQGAAGPPGPGPSPRRSRFGYELRFYATIVVAAVLGFVYPRFTSVREDAAGVHAGLPIPIKLVAIAIAGYALYAYIRHKRTDDGPSIPTLEKFSFVALVILILHTSHHVGAWASVDADKLVIYEPALALLGDSTFRFDDITGIAIQENSKGKEELAIRRRGKNRPDTFNLDDLVLPLLPHLAKVADDRQIPLDGF